MFVSGSISIHAPRVGSDHQDHRQTLHMYYFNPRSPCGERLYGQRDSDPFARFQSTVPVWGASKLVGNLLATVLFQSTLPVWGATKLVCNLLATVLFQSTLPVWGATMYSRQAATWTGFQSTLPVWGATLITIRSHGTHGISIHAPRVGSDRRMAHRKR